MPCYVDMVHLERARATLIEARETIALLRNPNAAESVKAMSASDVQELIAAALDDISHANDDIKQPLPAYVPKATTITEAQTTKES